MCMYMYIFRARNTNKIPQNSKKSPKSHEFSKFQKITDTHKNTETSEIPKITKNESSRYSKKRDFPKIKKNTPKNENHKNITIRKANLV